MAVKVADEAGRRFWYSTRGDLQQVESHNGVHVTGAMDSDAMTAFCREHEIKLITGQNTNAYSVSWTGRSL